jgi:NAD(P)-dependent dehydrogenase (short-subunit alcohol dehydrogenase family)
MSWNERRVLVTGASQGLGRALVLELARRGAQVVGVARKANALEATMREAGGHAIIADVADAPEAIAAQVAELGGVDVVVHNASTLGPTPLPELADLDDRDLERVFEVNVLGPQRLTRALLGPMRRAGRGWIVAISSDAAVEAYGGWGAYGASKAALDHLMRVLAAELEGTGVRALAIDPGEMNTAMHAAAMPDADPSKLADPNDVAGEILDRALDLASGSRVRVDALKAAGAVLEETSQKEKEVE